MTAAKKNFPKGLANKSEFILIVISLIVLIVLVPLCLFAVHAYRFNRERHAKQTLLLSLQAIHDRPTFSALERRLRKLDIESISNLELTGDPLPESALPGLRQECLRADNGCQKIDPLNTYLYFTITAGLTERLQFHDYSVYVLFDSTGRAYFYDVYDSLVDIDA